MKYKDFEGSAASTSKRSRWYETEELAECLRTFQKKNYSAIEDRIDAIKMLKGLDTEAPFAEDRRFPEDKYYINEAYGGWENKFQLLRGTLRDNSKEDQRFMNAFVFHFYSINTILKRIEDKRELFSRSSFERYYNLTWQDEPDGEPESIEPIAQATSSIL